MFAAARGQTILHHAFRIPAGPKLLHYLNTAIGLGAKDSRDLRGKFASQMYGDIFSMLLPNGNPNAIEHLDQARKLVKATRPAD